MNKYLYPYVIDFRCKSNQITEFLLKQYVESAVFDEKYKFATITVDRSRYIDFETYFELINNKILSNDFQDVKNIVILMAQFVRTLLQNNLYLDGNYDWKHMILQLDCSCGFQGVILLNLQEKISQNIIIFAAIVTQLANKLNLSQSDQQNLRTLVDDLTKNNFTKNVSMQIENNHWKKKDKLKNQMTAAIDIFKDNNNQITQLSTLEIRCQLSIKNIQFIEILLNQQPSLEKFSRNQNNAEKNQQQKTKSKKNENNLPKNPQLKLIDRLREQFKSVNNQLHQNLKNYQFISEWLQMDEDNQILDTFILKYLQLIGFFNSCQFQQEIIVQQFQIHMQSYLLNLFLMNNNEQPKTIDEYLKKLIVMECIENSCILQYCQADYKLNSLINQIKKMAKYAEYNQIELVEEDYLKLFKKFGLTQRKTLYNYLEQTKPQDFLDQLLINYPDWKAIKQMKESMKQFIQNPVYIPENFTYIQIKGRNLEDAKKSFKEQLNFCFEIIESYME